MRELHSQTVVGRVVDNTVVLAHTDQSPSDQEWEQILTMFSGVADRASLRVLVHTLGAAPDARQRSRLNDALKGTTPKMAVLSDLASVRAAGTAISWFQPKFRVFKVAEVEQALDHLEARGPERERLRRALDDLRVEVSPTGAKSKSAGRV